VVLAARRGSPEGHAALAALCEAYWYPLYAFARRQGRQEAEAQDLIQAFFARLLEKDSLRLVRREAGRFRSFLLMALRRFAAKERKREQAKKRGGGFRRFSLDLQDAERRYSMEPSHNWTPEKIYERRWALTVLDNVLAKVAKEYANRGKTAMFLSLQPYLAGEQDLPTYAQIARQLDMSEAAVKVAVHRLRQRFRRILQEQIAQTVADASDIDNELRCLMAALKG
jgi:RNA polymerase sigma-70 factor (ECF subfamily)